MTSLALMEWLYLWIVFAFPCNKEIIYQFRYSFSLLEKCIRKNCHFVDVKVVPPIMCWKSSIYLSVCVLTVKDALLALENSGSPLDWDCIFFSWFKTVFLTSCGGIICHYLLIHTNRDMQASTRRIISLETSEMWGMLLFTRIVLMDRACHDYKAEIRIGNFELII